jgi:hypothetical protein
MDNQTLSYLEQVRHNLEYVDYDIICQSVAALRDKFVPTALIKKGWSIDRVRVNRNGEVFTNIKQVSYIHDKNILDNREAFGRANEPKQAVFYGAIESPAIKQPRIVAYLETSELHKALDMYDNIQETFTVSRWRVMEDIEVIEMIFSDEALKVNEYNKLSLQNQIKNYGHLQFADHYERQGILFSNEFARNDVKKGEDYKYKISVSYANYVWNNTPLKGITYPSVQSNYLGQNIALLPEVVDKCLRLEMVGMFRFERKDGINLPIDSFKNATDLGEDLMSFKWIDYVRAKQ